MAKTGDTPARKAKPKSRSRAARPSFAPPAATAASPAWVYRSDAPAAAAKPVAATKSVAATRQPVKTAVKPPAAPPRRARAPMTAAPATRASRVTHALDVVTMPIAVSLMAVLAPMRRLLGPSRH